MSYSSRPFEAARHGHRTPERPSLPGQDRRAHRPTMAMQTTFLAVGLTEEYAGRPSDTTPYYHMAGDTFENDPSRRRPLVISR